MTRHALVIVVAALLLMGTARAQQPVCEANCVVRVGQPFVAFTEAESGASYRLYINNVLQTTPFSLVPPNVEFAFPAGLAAGSYSLVLELVLSSGAVVRTDPLSLTVQRRKAKVRG